MAFPATLVVVGIKFWIFVNITLSRENIGGTGKSFPIGRRRLSALGGGGGKTLLYRGEPLWGSKSRGLRTR